MLIWLKAMNKGLLSLLKGRKAKNTRDGPKVRMQPMFLFWNGILISSRAKKVKRGKTCL